MIEAKKKMMAAVAVKERVGGLSSALCRAEPWSGSSWFRTRLRGGRNLGSERGTFSVVSECIV